MIRIINRMKVTYKNISYNRRTRITYSISRITYNVNRKKRKRLKDSKMEKTVMQQQLEMTSMMIKR